MTIRQYIEKTYGIGKNQIKTITTQLGIKAEWEFKSLARFERLALLEYLEERTNNRFRPVNGQKWELFPVDKMLKWIVGQDVRDLMKSNHIVGRKHRGKLPVRGQRTHTNAITRKNLSAIPKI